MGRREKMYATWTVVFRTSGLKFSEWFPSGRGFPGRELTKNLFLNRRTSAKGPFFYLTVIRVAAQPAASTDFRDWGDKLTYTAKIRSWSKVMDDVSVLRRGTCKPSCSEQWVSGRPAKRRVTGSGHPEWRSLMKGRGY